MAAMFVMRIRRLVFAPQGAQTVQLAVVIGQYLTKSL